MNMQTGLVLFAARQGGRCFVVAPRGMGFATRKKWISPPGRWRRVTRVQGEFHVDGRFALISPHTASEGINCHHTYRIDHSSLQTSRQVLHSAPQSSDVELVRRHPDRRGSSRSEQPAAVDFSRWVKDGEAWTTACGFEGQTGGQLRL
jgi:hypothetical protein